MFILKDLPARRLLRWNLPHICALATWSILCVAVYDFSGLHWLTIPWLPLSLIGTAVAFYVGFKNNSAYDRIWEARKIWGGIVNTSRAWGAAVRAFIPKGKNTSLQDAEIRAIHKRLIYRHLAWLYALRSQLLTVKSWEHAAQEGKVGRTARLFQKEFGVGLIDDDITRDELNLFLPPEEFQRTIRYQNTATQILDRQSQELRDLHADELFDDFRHMEFQKLLTQLYEHQGKAERIKNYPLPRQYANFGSVFVNLFLILLPFGMVSEFSSLGSYGTWWSVPFTILVGWVFRTMESIGDYSENPFQGMANDIPMFALCRTIEIDLLEMLGETEIPPAVEAKNGVLM